MIHNSLDNCLQMYNSLDIGLEIYYSFDIGSVKYHLFDGLEIKHSLLLVWNNIILRACLFNKHVTHNPCYYKIVTVTPTCLF